jgi:hypothetical protein
MTWLHADLHVGTRRIKSHMRVQKNQEPSTDLPASVRRMRSNLLTYLIV